MYHARQIERHAIAAYVHYGVRLAVPLSPSARRELARLRRSSRAGLAELAMVQALGERPPFTSATEWHEYVLAQRSKVHTATVREEEWQANLATWRNRHNPPTVG